MGQSNIKIFDDFMGHEQSEVESRLQHKERFEAVLKMVWMGYRV